MADAATGSAGASSSGSSAGASSSGSSAAAASSSDDSAARAAAAAASASKPLRRRPSAILPAVAGRVREPMGVHAFADGRPNEVLAEAKRRVNARLADEQAWQLSAGFGNCAPAWRRVQNSERGCFAIRRFARRDCFDVH